MGFHSWKTVHGESIPCNQSKRETSPVYLLQPNGMPPIKEDSYDGYGNFGGVNAYAWLASQNYGDPKFRDIAMRATRGSLIYLEDNSNVFIPAYEKEILTEYLAMKGNVKPIYVYQDSQEILPNSMTPAQMRQHKLGASDTLAYPLKFSHRPDDRYENFENSEECLHQGFFYPEQWGFVAITSEPIMGAVDHYRLCEKAHDPEYGLIRISEVSSLRKDVELILIPESQLQKYLTFHLENFSSTPHIARMDVEVTNQNAIESQLKLTRDWKSQVLMREAEKLNVRVKNLSPAKMIGLLSEQASKLSIRMTDNFQQALLTAMEQSNLTISNAVQRAANTLPISEAPSLPAEKDASFIVFNVLTYTQISQNPESFAKDAIEFFEEHGMVDDIRSIQSGEALIEKLDENGDVECHYRLDLQSNKYQLVENVFQENDLDVQQLSSMRKPKH